MLAKATPWGSVEPGVSMTEHEETRRRCGPSRNLIRFPMRHPVAPRSRRKRVLVVVSVVAVLIVAAGLVSACRNQPLSQAYKGRFGSYVTP
jgi:hypothetical protein